MAWIVDTAHTQVEFAVKHMMIATVRGRFGTFSGTLNLNPNDPTLSTAEGTIETASLDTRDPNRDAHLRSPDFFDVEKFPTVAIRTTGVTRTGEGRYAVKADLTVKDITREVTFDVTDEGSGKDPWGNLHWGFSATTTFNRKDFGLNWNVALEAGGWLVGDQVKVTVDMEAIYKADAPAPEGQAVAAGAAA